MNYQSRIDELSDDELVAECDRRGIGTARYFAAINPEDVPRLEFKFGQHYGHTPDGACETCRQDAENSRTVYFRTKAERDDAQSAREEQREACARRCPACHGEVEMRRFTVAGPLDIPTLEILTCGNCAWVRSAPLTATPLQDRIAVLEAALAQVSNTLTSAISDVLMAASALEHGGGVGHEAARLVALGGHLGAVLTAAQKAGAK